MTVYIPGKDLREALYPMVRDEDRRECCVRVVDQSSTLNIVDDNDFLSYKRVHFQE